MKKVSIIISVYNNKEDILKSITSVLNQTHKFWELIIIDDCSTDGTYDLIKKFILSIQMNSTSVNELPSIHNNESLSLQKNRPIELSESPFLQKNRSIELSESLPPSHSLSVSPSLSVPPSLSIPPSHSLSIPPSPSLSLSLPHSPSLSVPPSPSLSLSLPPSHSLSLSPSPSLSLSLPPSHSLSLSPSPSLSLPPSLSSESYPNITISYKGNQIILIKNLINKGFYASLNDGIRISTGQFITLLGSDDGFHRRKLEIQLSMFNTNKIVGIISKYCRGKTSRKQGESTILFKKNIIKKIGYYDSVRFGADTEFIYRIYKVYGRRSIRKINHILYFAKIRKGSLTNNIHTGCYGEGKLIRAQYKIEYSKWHSTCKKLYMPYPIIERPFPVNPKMYDK